MSAPAVRAAVASAAAGVAAARARIAADHAAGAAGLAAAALATDLLDDVVRGVWTSLVADLPAPTAAALGRRVAVVAHGGFGRREMAPHSDVDVMLLHDAAGGAAAAAASRPFLQDLFDAGLQVGQSVRGVAEACRLAAGDATILSTLLDCRTLAGPPELAAQLAARLRRLVRRAPRRHAARLVAARRDEADRFGHSVALLEPNVKRSPGGLRDVQLIRWLGRVLHDAGTLDELVARGGLTTADADAVAAAAEFLTRVRIDLHLAAGRCADDLTRDQQVRLAGVLGLETEAGVLGVERFMREYLGHTRRVARVVGVLTQGMGGADPARRVTARLLGHRVDGLFLVGPRAVAALPGRTERVAGDAAAIIRLVELSLLHDVPIAADTWEAVRRRAAALPRDPDASACGRFRGLFSPPAALAGGGRGLADALRRLHDAGILEIFVPEFAEARDLPQFNSFHAYTVDEHSLLAVEQGCRLAAAAGWPATEWRALPRPHLLLLALLLHDLGKGGIEDHSVVGAGIAARTGARLGLPGDETALVEFLVRHHLAMAKLAFRRDAGDESLVAEFARLVGGSELLRLLTLLTAADVAAVAPGTWTRWKADLLGDLHYRTLRCLDGEPPAAGLTRARTAVTTLLEERAADDPLRMLARDLPASYLGETPPERIVDELGRLARLPADGLHVAARWEPHTSTVAVTVITHERVAAGVFHRAVGGLAALHLDILAADIHTLADGHVIDHFAVVDPDCGEAPTAERLAEIAAAVRAALRANAAPEFRRRWNPFAPQPTGAARSGPQVRIDTTSSRHSTIVEVFAHDAPGLLYAVARAIFAAGLSVRAAKIGTYRDQVVDAFHVTDAAGRKVTDPALLDAARRAIEEAAAPLTRPA